jgi:hypothetical protein
MPIPAIAGLPWLAGLMGGLFSSLVSWFMQFVTKRLAVVAAVISGFVALTVAFLAALEGLVSVILLNSPIELTFAAQLIIPSNFTLCITTMLTARTARWVYDWNIKIIQLKLF